MPDNYVFEAYALLVLITNQAGADQVAALLSDTTNTLYVSAINVGEVYYILLRRHGLAAAMEVERDTFGQPNLSVVEPTWDRVRSAAAIKAEGGISFADAFAAALCQEIDAPLVTGDPEFRRLETRGLIRVQWLPHR